MADELKWTWIQPSAPGMYVYRTGPDAREAHAVYLSVDEEGEVYMRHPSPIDLQCFVNDWMDNVYWYGPLPGVP